MASKKRSAEEQKAVDPKKLCMSSIVTMDDFLCCYPDYEWDKTSKLPTPKCLNDQCVFTIVSDLAKRLVQCDRAVVIDNETSKYPFVYELLKYLVRLTDTHYSVKNVEIEPNDIEMVADEFIRNSDAKQLEEETMVNTIMRWERHFKSLKSPLRTYGYVEFCVEDSEGQVIKMVEVKDTLGNNVGDAESCIGVYQAAGEAARACEENVSNAEKKGDSAITTRKARVIKQIEEREKSLTRTFRPSPAERKADREAEELRRAAEEAEREDEVNLAAAIQAAKDRPVYVVLTSFSSWVFIKAQNKVITTSKVFTAFPKTAKITEPHPAFLDVIQFMTSGLGINLANTSALPTATDVHATLIHRLALSDTSDNGKVLKFLSGVYSECQTFINTLQFAGLTVENIERLFKMKFPEALWEQFKPPKLEPEAAEKGPEEN